MSNSKFFDPKLFGGLKNDEDPKQISQEYFVDCRNVNYPDTGILGIQKILMPEVVAVFLSPDLEEDISDTITITGDSITTATHSGTYLWDDTDTKWSLSQWS